MISGRAVIAHTTEQEVCSEVLRVEAKLFFLDARINGRGPYLKISEKGNSPSRSRSTIVLPAAGIPWFRELFRYYSGGTGDNGPLVPKECPVESKVFFFELGENSRGRFLRLSESGAGPRGRSSLIIPSGGNGCEGWTGFRIALQRVEEVTRQAVAQLIPEALGLPFQVSVTGSSPIVGPGPTPPSIADTLYGGQIVRAGHKRYFFDSGSNQKGDFIRITEVVGPDRIALMLPMEALPQFQAALSACLQQHLAERPLQHHISAL